MIVTVVILQWQFGVRHPPGVIVKLPSNKGWQK